MNVLCKAKCFAINAICFGICMYVGPSWNPGSNKVIRAKQYQDFVKVFAELDSSVKLVCVCGNHDIGDVPTAATVQVYRTQFGSEFFWFWVGGVKFVVLNSQYFEAPDALPKETKTQLDFISKSIADPTAKHIGENLLATTLINLYLPTQ